MSKTSTFLGVRLQSVARQFRSMYEAALDHGSVGRQGSSDQGDAGNAALRSDPEAPLAYPEQARASAAEFVPEAGARAGDQVEAGFVPTAFVPGVTVDGRYLIEKELDRSVFSVVFLARDQKLHDTPVVIKVLQEQAIKGENKAWFLHRFKEEVQALARIDHPGVVRALDVGLLPDGRTFLVMQHVAGMSLRSAISTHGMDLERVARLILQIGQALEVAHRQGVIHRDLKPENIMLQRAGDEEFTKLIDFGIATVLDLPIRSNMKSTRVAGTIDYMAPEQLEGKPTVASDIYALGVISYEMVTGRRPFNPDYPHQLRDLQQAGVRIKPCDLRPSLSEAAQAVILKALSLAPQDRYPRAQDFCQALNHALTGGASRESELPITPIPLGPLLSALFFVLSVCLTLVITRRFLTNTPDIYGVSISFLLWLLCLSVGTTFTRSGQQWVERGFARFNIKPGSFSRWRATFTLAGLLAVGAIYLTLPAIARIYNNKRGIQFYQSGDLPAAIRSYERAISLDPGYAVAHYNLASAYEDVLEYDKSVGEYRAAVRLDPKFHFAYNNLAHLYLAYRKDYPSALKILNEAIELGPREPELKYTLYTNRGWAHLGLGLYDLAIEDLRTAINSRQDGAAAHCLLAQALETQKKGKAALQEWENCVANAPGETNIEASWLSIAQERLRQAGAK